MRGPGYGHVKEDVYHHMSFKRTVAMLGALLAQPKPFFFGAGISGTRRSCRPELREQASGKRRGAAADARAARPAVAQGRLPEQRAHPQQEEYIAASARLNM